MEGLAEKGLVRRERIGEPIVEKWGLLLEGEKMANACLQFERAVKDSIMKSDQFRGNGNRVSIVMDNREDIQFRERLKWHCEDQDIVFQEKELPAGDYLFLTQAEEVFPIIIERKTWSDLADSVMGKGRGRRRLDCVKIGSTSEECERRKCQLCKMKKSGLNQRIFFIEGSRCHGRDGIRSKCSLQKRCQPCKQLIERHGSEVVQETLEQVLNKLQIEHGCHIHFTRSYNETIESLIMIRNLIEDGETFATLRAAGNTTVPLQRKDNQSTISYQQFCSNIRDPQAQFAFANRKRGDVNDWTALHLANVLSQEPTDWGKELCMELYGVTPIESDKSEPCPKPSDRPTNLLQSCDDLKSTDKVIDLSESQNSMDLNDSLDSVVMLDESQDSVVILDMMNDNMSTDDSIVVLDDVVNVKHQGSTSTLNESRQSSARTSVKKSYLCGLNIPNAALYSCPLLIIHRWGEHDKDFYDKFNAVWQGLYRKTLNRAAPVADDLYDEAVRQLSQLVCKDDFPFIPRQIMSFVMLWLQIKLGIQVRIVTTNSQADHIKNLWSQKQHHPGIRTQSNSVKSGIRQTERGKRKLDFSNPSPIDKSKGTSFNSPRCNKNLIDERPKKSRRALNSEKSATTEARLRRFQKEDASSKVPPSNARIQNDFLDSEQSSGWTCFKCTLENGDYDEVCLMCEQSRNSNKSIPPSHHTLKTCNETKKSSWSCPQCTFENSIESAQCLLCNATIKIQPNTPISHSKSHTYAPLDSPRSSYDVRMVSETSQKQEGSIWACSYCTLENSVKDSRCSACHKLKYEAQATPPSKSQMSSSFESSSIQKSYTTQNSYRQVTSSASTILSKGSGVKCGACGAFGHNRGSANEHNCAAFFEEVEVNKRAEKRTKAREKAEKERDELERMKAEELMTREKGEKSLKEMQQIVADHEQSLQGHSRLQKEDIKRREKRLKNAQRRAGRL
jgi:ERCC4-type nuclease